MFFLGIDIAKTNHVASLIDDTGTVLIKSISFKNDIDGYDKLLAALAPFSTSKDDFLIAMEATGHYWLALFSSFVDDGYSVSVYNPFQIKSFRGAFHNRKQKTDIIDALIIATYLRTFGTGSTSLPNDFLLSLKQLTRYRTSMVSNVSALKNQTLAILDKIFPEFDSLFSDTFGETAKQILLKYPTPELILKANSNSILKVVHKASKGRLKRDFVTKLVETAKKSFGIKLTTNACSFEVKQLINQIIFLEEQISELDSEIASIYKELDTFLITIPGIGNTLAPVILAEIGDINNFSDPSKLVAFAGIDPSSNQSGNKLSLNEKTSKRGSPYLRHALFTAAFVAMNNDPHLRAFYDRKKAEGKHHYVAMAGVQRKLIGIIWSVLKEHRPYSPYKTI